MNMSWIDLSSFGIDFKRVELPNDSAFPVAVITDLDKYKASGATSLELLKDNHESGFKKLPGEKKGRGFNTPVLFLTNSYEQNGKNNYKIISSLAKLLNTTEENINSFKKVVESKDVILKNAFFDLQKFESTIQDCTQQYFGNILYVVKENLPEKSLTVFADELKEKQHGLFMKASFDNIPIDTLNDFNYSSSIIDRAFLNPIDAKKNGYNLSDLEAVHLNGETSVLPISMNKDLSINIIKNIANIPQLAYSNYNWKKNNSLIDDYNALVSLRETSRSILNARLGTISTKHEMESHLELISSTLHNFIEVNGYSRSNTAIKYNKSPEDIFIFKNEDDEWRYIEKHANKKVDLPLTFDNYKKAVTTIANYNTTLSAALVEEVKTGVEFEYAINKVFKNHDALFKNYVNVSEGELVENKINVNLIGKKIHANKIKSFERAFERNVGEDLYEEQVKKLLGQMSLSNGSNLSEQLGGNVVDALHLERAVTIHVEDASEPVLDVGLQYLDSIELPVTSGKIKLEENVSLNHNTNSIEKYQSLPSGISPLVDANYVELNKIYSTLQYVELVSKPWLEHLKSTLSSDKNQDEIKLIKQHINSVIQFAQMNEENSTINPELSKDISSKADVLDNIETLIQKESIKANILKYQFTKNLGDIDYQTYGLLAFNKNENGEFKPFKNKAEYIQEINLIKQENLKNSINNGYPSEFTNDIKEKLDYFVENHYFKEVNHKQNIGLDDLKSKDFIINKIQYQPMKSISSLPEKLNDVYVNIQDAILNGVKGYLDSSKNLKLDESFVIISKIHKTLEDQSGISNPLNLSNDFHSILTSYSNITLDRLKGYDRPKVFNPSLNTPLSDLSKINLMKSLYGQINATIEKKSGISFDSTQNELAFIEATKTAQDKLQLNPVEFQQNLAAQYLLQNHGLFHGNETPEFTEKVTNNFNQYLIKSIASELDVNNDELLQILKISESIKLGVDDTLVNAQLSLLMGRNFTIEQLKGSNQTLNNSNKEFAINNKSGLIAKLANFESTLNHHILLNNFGNLEEFHKVKSYLTATPQESIHINSQEQNIEAVIDISADYAKSSLKANNLGLNSADLVVITNIPKTHKEPVIARFIKNEWVQNSNINSSNLEREFNCSYNTISQNLTRENVLTEIKNLITGVNPNCMQPSMPIEKNLSNLDSKIKLDEKPLIQLLSPNKNNSTDDIVFRANYAKTNFENALNNLPKDLKETLIASIEGNKKVNPHIRISMSLPSNSGLQELQISSVTSSHPLQSKTLTTTTLNDLTQNIIGSQALRVDNGVFKLEPSECDSYLPSHNHLLNLSGFNIENIRNQVKVNRAELFGEHSKFINKFEIDSPLSYKNIITKYAEITKDQIGNSEKNYYLHLGNEEFLPQITISDTIESKEIVSKDTPLEYIENSILRMSIEQNLVPSEFIIDNLKPIEVNPKEIDVDILAIARTNFITQLNNTIYSSLHNINPTEAIDNSKVYIKINNESASIAVAQSEQQCLKLTSDSYQAILTNSPHSTGFFENVSKFNNDLQAKNNILDIVNEIRITANSLSDTPSMDSEAVAKKSEDVGLLQVFDSIDNAVEKLAEQSEIDLLEATVLNQTTTYPEVLNNDLTKNIENLSTAEMYRVINVDNLWPKKPISNHIEASHQALDTILLSKILRYSLNVNENDIIRDYNDVNSDINLYTSLVSNIYTAVSNSNTTTELLNNFDKAYSKTANLDQQYIREFDSKIGGVLSSFKKASYSHLNEGLSVNEALNGAFKDNKYINSLFNENVVAAALNEKLTNSEVSFINYFDGYAFSSNNSSKEVNIALAARISDERINNGFDYDLLKTSTPKITQQTIDKLNAITPITFDVEKEQINLKSKWGVDFKIGEHDKLFAKGHVDVTDAFLTSLSSKLNGVTDFTSIQVNTTDYKDSLFVPIFRLSLDKKNINEIESSFVDLVFRQIEHNEKKHMSNEDLAKFDTYVRSGLGLVGFIHNEGYTPKTQGAMSLNKFYEDLKSGENLSVEKNPVQILLDKSHLHLKSIESEIISSNNHSHVDEFVLHLSKSLEGKQDVVLKAIEDKIKKISARNSGDMDLYSFKELDSTFNKISNVSFVAPKSIIEKFIETKYANCSSSVKKEAKSEIELHFENSQDLISLSQEHLKARATHKFIELLDAYCPNGVSGSQKFVDSINKELGSFIQIQHLDSYLQTEYSSKFASTYVENEKINSIGVSYTEDKPKHRIGNMLNCFLKSTLDLDVASLELNLVVSSSEKKLGIESLTNIITSLKADSALEEKTLTIENDLNKTNSLEV